MKLWRRSAGIAHAMATIALAFSVSAGWATQLRSHCFSHEASAQSGPGQHHHQPGLPSPAWANADGHDCDHCPPSECSRAAPCSVSAGGALVAGVALLVPLSAHGVELPSRPDAPAPSPIQPPTPPPQPIS